MSRKIIAIGETVLDIFFKNGVAYSSCPGGSVLNTAVSLGRSGIPVTLISDIGSDHTGGLIEIFLQSNNIDTSLITKYTGVRTPIALAFLNDKNEASYSFYKHYPDVREINPNIEINSEDIVIFGSFFAITTAIRPQLVKLLNKCVENDALVIYDPNFRRPHLNVLQEPLPLIEENIRFADIIRASDEDMRLIFDAGTYDDALENIPTNKGFLYTHAGNSVQYRINNISNFIIPPKIHPVSTVGAGDSFNAGLIYALFTNCINKRNLPDLDELIIAKMINTGISFATDVCMSQDNFISKEFASEFLINRQI